MTPNEKELLEKFKKVPKGSAVTMSKKLHVSIEYAQKLCNGLVVQKLIKEVAGGRYISLPEPRQKKERPRAK